VAELEALLTQITEAVAARTPPREMGTRVVAVDGLGAAGKSTFARHLAKALGDCPVIHTDDFASWDNPLDWWPALIEQVLEPLSRGEVARFTPTQWSTDHRPEPVEVVSGEFLVLEGVSASRQEFQPYLPYAILIETSPDTRLRRGIERDGEEARPEWEAWMADEDAYRERGHGRMLAADFVLEGERDLWT
jgi:uridine kinase